MFIESHATKKFPEDIGKHSIYTITIKENMEGAVISITKHRFQLDMIAKNRV